METDIQRLTRFYADFEKLVHNREKVSIQQLTTQYARSYNTLVAEVMDGAVWFHRKYLEVFAFPTHPKDEAGNKWLAQKIASIDAEEKQIGRLTEQFRAALIDRLDMDKYENLVYFSYERRRLDIFDPYWQRHNKWVGPPERRLVYNDIFNKYWWPKTQEHPDSGCWVNSDYSGRDYRFPPQLKEEIE
ncbi:MAG: hypothetical protein HFF00_04895 [Ruminiclostridium sp.]|jgi:hypothetical protein|nr:hypothetical protein [Ruminiclostridium sp.]